MEEHLVRKLAFVAPERRKEVERRLSVLERYRAIEEPVTADADAAAAELGMSRGGFYRLFAAWSRTRDPAELERISGRTERRSRTDHPAADFIRDAFSRMPIGRVLEHDLQDLLSQAEREGVNMRNRPALRALLRRLRAERDLAGASARGLVLDHVALELPVDTGDDRAPVMPIATVIADMRMRKIVSIRLDIYSVGPVNVAAAIARAAAAGVFVRDPDPPSTLEWMRTRDDGWERLERALGSAGVILVGERKTSARGGDLAGPLVFPTLLGVATRPGIVSKSVDRRRAKVRARGDAVLKLAEAQRLMDERLGYSPNPALPFSSDPALLSDLSA